MTGKVRGYFRGTGKRSIVVTGVSSGIGLATVKAMTAKRFHVFGSVRRQADGERLIREFGDSFTPLLFDVTDAKAVAAAAAEVRLKLNGETLAGLVNNAGIVVSGPLLHLPVEEFRTQLEVNLTGVVIAIQAFAPLLGADPSLRGPKGRIVMISSVSGTTGSPFIAPYCASKFGLEGLSEALRRELLLYGIDVVVVAPGPVKTAVWSKAEQVNMTPYLSTPFGPALEKVRAYMLGQESSALKPEVLGKVVMRALTSAKPKVRYVATPTPMQEMMMTLLPKRTVDQIIGKTLGLLPR
jgi:NAD(P)-dependent dehydrogenase (short-subunit alcohol dehydrogenase family)